MVDIKKKILGRLSINTFHPLWPRRLAGVCETIMSQNAHILHILWTIHVRTAHALHHESGNILHRTELPNTVLHLKTAHFTFGHIYLFVFLRLCI